MNKTFEAEKAQHSDVVREILRRLAPAVLALVAVMSPGTQTFRPMRPEVQDYKGAILTPGPGVRKLPVYNEHRQRALNNLQSDKKKSCSLSGKTVLGPCNPTEYGRTVH